MSVLTDMRDRFFGRGRSSTTVPQMDGTMKPNTALDMANQVYDVPGADDIAVGADGSILVAAGNAVLEITDGKVTNTRTYAAAVTALAADDTGRIALALAGQEIHVTEKGGESWSISEAAGVPFNAVSALSFSSDGSLLACDASQQFGLADWRQDFITSGATGRVIRISPDGASAQVLAKNLSFPNGVVEASGLIYVSESWKHRVIGLDPETGVLKTSTLPLAAYPARLKAQTGGGLILSFLAPRLQIFELVLRHKEYRRRMVAEVPQDYWIAPNLGGKKSFLDPLQGGAIRQLGILKPWAPSTSYGLVACLADDLTVERSFHSRADGKYHGTTSAVEAGGMLFVVSKGAEKVLQLPLAGDAQ